MGDELLVHPRYVAGAELGRGAQGVVLRVTDRENPTAALVAKVWREGRFSETQLAAEFALLRRLDVPGLVRAHDLARDARSGAAFFVEDFVPGLTASEHLASAEAERVERFVQVLSQVAATLGALHEAAFVHGDVKPAHVRVTPEGRVVLLDLGAAVSHAQARSTSPPLLTPAFAAPELLSGASPSPLSDLYSLGALGFALACGRPPRASDREVRTVARWVPPSIADVLNRLLSPHPRDRPESAEAVLGLLGQSGAEGARAALPAPVGREAELSRLLEPHVGVRYLVGESGVGKSYLLRDVVTRALTNGRAARRLVFPDVGAELVAELVAFFRGDAAAWPFTDDERSQGAPLLLALDHLGAAPLELAAALDAYRCRGACSRPLDVLAVSAEAPDGAERVELGALAPSAFAELCRRLGSCDSTRIAELTRVTRRNPGWLVAAHGRVPLTREMVLERTRELPRPAQDLLACVALLGGELPAAYLPKLGYEDEAASLLQAGLLTRRHGASGAVYALYAAALAPELAAGLGSFELAEQLATQLLAEEQPVARRLLSLAGCAFPPEGRERLLDRAHELAARAGLESERTEALLALAGSDARRTPALLVELERSTRSAGNNHPEVLEWLRQAAARDPELRVLALRRSAEQAARQGDYERAARLAGDAEACATARGDRLGEALALGTRGAVCLFRADVPGAEAALRASRARLATLEVHDLEELARVDHNLGVVALYRDRLAEAAAAFERSLGLKRRLGDRAGVRACLLNLGLTHARQGRYDDARKTLDEAHALARSLGQHAGRAWCLAARADVELRRGDAALAERFVAEAEAISQAPPSVRADLCLLRGQLALTLGDASAARQALGALDPELRGQDTMIDARARLIEAGALLASLPAAPRAAARLAIAAARAARAARLTEVEAQALAVLRRARRKSATELAEGYTRDVPNTDGALWSFLERLAGAAVDDAAADLLRLLKDLSGAERALLVVCDREGAPERAWGVDLDGFPLSSALSRCDGELVRAALLQGAPLYRRDVQTPAGRGSQLAVPFSRALLQLEHRFRVGCFDGLDAEQTKRFGVLASLVTRACAPSDVNEPAASPARPEAERPGDTTALPERPRRRSFPGIIGQSRALDRALSRLDSAVESELPVLIVGETGTGKELFARALHEAGARAAGPLVAVNCAAIPEALFEAELFGHARGAFTGAERARAGLLARAEGGTLFLDELGELPLPRQAALLRVLETRRFRPVGSDEERAIDVRIVSATNRSLEAEVERGKFRQDLLYRVNVIEIRVPPLRERPEDVAPLVRHFLARDGSRAALSAEAMLALESYGWPGNVRELEHQVQRLLALGSSRIELLHLPRALRRAPPVRPARVASTAIPVDARAEVELALQRAKGNITHAARALGLTRHGLKKRMLRLGLRAAIGEGEPS